MRILALVTDGFGGHGGIAKFNRDVLTAFASHPECAQIVALPRVMSGPPGPLPRAISWRTEGLGGKLRYVRSLIRTARGLFPGPIEARNTKGAARAFDLILCGHINLLPLAVLARSVLALGPARVSQRGALGHGGDWLSVFRRHGPTLHPPIVLVIHGKECWKPTCARWSDFLLGQVDAVVSVSELSRSRFFGWAHFEGKPGFVLPNCADLSRFKPGERNREFTERYQLGRPVLLTLARLCAAERYKGIDEVLELIPALRQELPDITYIIAGDGDDRARLAAKARSLGLSVSVPGADRGKRASVVFTGYVPESEKPDLYRAADAFVMPGWGEGFGIVYLEALACGVPVVGSKADASREFLHGCESAFLADPNDPDDIWNAICRALAAPRGTVPGKVRSFSNTRFTQGAFALFGELKRLCPASGRRDGRCTMCGRPVVGGASRCLKHLVQAREWERKKRGLKGRYLGRMSYRMEAEEGKRGGLAASGRPGR